ncbi:5-oxoprolinase subunit PxpA [Flavobacteriaceae bacterium R38]|nr:5-oxoprolinase subunit PxpA [Flavobacteriaceae bacterium R38]
MKNQVDINCDVGEGLDNEAHIFPLISRCNIACGAHAGDPDTIRKVIKLAKENNVLIGAHPSYPDRENFGRKVMDISKEDLVDSIVSQLTLFFEIATEEKVDVDHIKPHGALYNEAAKNKEVAEAVITAIERVGVESKVKLMAPNHSVIASLAQSKNFNLLYEAFVDRNYNEDLNLVSRSNKNALIESAENAVEHVIRMVNGEVLTISGELVKIKASSFCIHGDNKNVLDILKHLFKELPEQGFDILK